jgi:myosin protein heavy chain
LVTVNPYCPLPIYSREYINMYRGRGREETKPHIFAMADEAFRNLVDEGTNQSILVTYVFELRLHGDGANMIQRRVWSRKD